MRFKGIPIKYHNRNVRFQVIQITSTDPFIPFHTIPITYNWRVILFPGIPITSNQMPAPPANPENREEQISEKQSTMAGS
jgi:hypothetical protein